MLGLCCTAWTRAAAEASVRVLLLSPRFLKVLVALKAADKSSMQASVRPVISTLKKKKKNTTQTRAWCCYWGAVIKQNKTKVLEGWTHSNSSSRQFGCATASHKCLTPRSPTLFKPTLRDVSREEPLHSREPISSKTSLLSLHLSRLKCRKQLSHMKFNL